MQRGQIKDSEVIKTVTDNKEATMNAVVSNSVAKAVLKLRANYLGTPPNNEKLEKLFNSCRKELIPILAQALQQYNITQPQIEEVVIYILNKTLEELSWLDVVTLYLPKTQDQQNDDSKQEEKIEYDLEKLALPLKDVLPLVWVATNDNVKFVHNYPSLEEEIKQIESEIKKSDNQEECKQLVEKSERLLNEFRDTPPDKYKLLQAERDQPKRLLTFYECLVRAKAGICHLGIRNELVLTLNEVHEGIHILEDATATILYFLKTKINQKFWEFYKNKNLPADTKKHLVDGLYQWMTESNPRQILTIIDPENGIQKELLQLFLDNGTNPYFHTVTFGESQITLEKMIQKAFDYLDFACNPKEYPTLAQTNEILSDSEPNQSLERNQALEFVQEWIRKQYQFENSHENKLIAQYYTIYKAHKNYIKNKYYLYLNQSMSLDEFKELNRIFSNYFQEVVTKKAIPSINAETIQIIQKFNNTVRAARTQGMNAQIENYLAKWYAAQPNSNEEYRPQLQQQYALLLLPAFQEAVILNDETVLKYKTIVTEEKISYIDIPFYALNRTFLHAIIVKPENWSPLFVETLKELLNFVKNNFNIQKSYSDLTKEEKNTWDFRKSSYPAILLNQIEYLLKIYEALHSENAVAQLAVAERSKPEAMIYLPDRIKTYNDWVNIKKYLTLDNINSVYQPISVQINKLVFDEIIKNGLSNFFRTFHQVAPIGYPTLLNILNPHIQNTYENLKRLASPPSEIFTTSLEKGYYYLAFLKVYGTEFRVDLGMMLQYFPVNERLTILLTLENKIFNLLIENPPQTNIVLLLPLSQRKNFIVNYYQAISMEHVLQAVSTLPAAEREDLLVSISPKMVEYTTQKLGYIDHIIEMLPKDRQVGFLEKLCLQLPKYVDKNSYPFGAVLSSISQKKRIDFLIALDKNLTNLIADVNQLVTILRKISEKDIDKLFEFKKALLNYVKTPADLKYLLSSITESKQVSFILKNNLLDIVNEDVNCAILSIPLNERIPFILDNDLLTNGKFELGKLVNYLPNPKSFLIENNLLAKIPDSVNLAFVLESLPENERADFVLENKFDNLINNFEDLRLLYSLPVADRYKVFIHCINILYLKTSQIQVDANTTLGDILNALPLDVAKNFLTTAEPQILFALITNAHSLYQLNKFLTVEEFEQLITVNNNSDYHLLKRLKNGKDVAKIATAFPEDLRENFIIQNKLLPLIQPNESKSELAHYYRSSDLAEVVKILPENRKANFILDFHLDTLIINSHELYLILPLLPINLRTNFAAKFNNIIKNCDDFVKISQNLPENEWGNFFAINSQLFDTILQNEEQLSSVLTFVPINDRLSFAKKFTIEYKHHNSVLNIVKQLQPEDRVDFLLSLGDKLHNILSPGWFADELFKLIPPNRVEFFLKQYILLPNTDTERLNYLFDSNYKLTTSLNNRILKDRRESFLASFGDDLVTVLKDNETACNIVSYIPQNKREEFITNYKLGPLITSGYYFQDLINLLPAHRQEPFIFSLMEDLKQNSNEIYLVNILKFIKKEHRETFLLSFDDKFQSLIPSDTILYDILTELPSSSYQIILAALGANKLATLFPSVNDLSNFFKNRDTSVSLSFLANYCLHISMSNAERQELLANLDSGWHKMEILKINCNNIVTLMNLNDDELKNLYGQSNEKPNPGLFSFSLFSSFYNSTAQQAYQNALLSINRQERYFVLMDYVNNPKNQNDQFYQNLVNTFGKDAFNIVKRETVTTDNSYRPGNF